MKQQFLQLLRSTNRQGIENVINWLEESDFFTAPASTKYHCACENGLVMHSVSVFNTMMEKHFDEDTDSIESFAICASIEPTPGFTGGQQS